MSWENILKRPMPIDTRSNRDEQHKQAIIQYEKNTIEPALTQMVANNVSLENMPFFIEVAKDKSEDEMTRSAYRIGKNTAANLGGNPEFILKVIRDLYTAEGYKVGAIATNDREIFIEISQP